MESIYNFSEKELLAFALIFLRTLAFIVSMPVIGTRNVSVQVKVLFALMISFILMPIVGISALRVNLSDYEAVTMVFKEVAVGLIMGFLARMFFMTMSMAGQLISISLGASSAQLFNPAFEESSTAFDQFFLIISTLFFFAMNAHHILLWSLVDAYRIVPLAQTSISLSALPGFGEVAEQVMKISLGFSAPIMVTILFTNAAMGLVGRAVPQINILITSLPVNTLVGMLVLFLTLPLLILGMDNLVGQTMNFIFAALRTL